MSFSERKEFLERKVNELKNFESFYQKNGYIAVKEARQWRLKKIQAEKKRYEKILERMNQKKKA